MPPWHVFSFFFATNWEEFSFLIEAAFAKEVLVSGFLPRLLSVDVLLLFKHGLREKD